MADGEAGPQRLSVRIGVGTSPFASDGLADGSFWALIESLERTGYDSIWLSDTAHLGGVAPLPVLAAVAARTQRLKLGTNVLVLPPRNPVLLARELATVDALSGGRMLPAGGLGIDIPAELEAMGVLKEERTARLEESIGIIKALWTGEPVTMRGRFWSLTDATLSPTPRRSKLEFWLGGTAPAALRRIGRIADGWLASFIGPEEFGAKVDLIRATAAEHDRSIDEDHYGTTVFSAPAEGQICAQAAALLDRREGLARTDHVAVGVDATRELLQRFIAQGATKFVLIPLADDPVAWLEELWPEVVAPLEAEGVVRPGSPAPR
ncbi:LLM class flavin-dependent oxidoreductase [Baekduia soli]|uniref:LLM class flavin-dependent oxidoreductase n=1 Tax=Baekduia soli TaxID=496014 RepID=A0A5B8UBX7_9ACTN|nr:LLM class flavin-dependent oxidoreductase [Baekduia soli]QEC50555.1 LLM class flavin-dependent oxidoreductase [Baekduia soli]